MKNKILTLGVLALIVFGGLFTQSCEQIKDAASFDIEKDMPAQKIVLDSTTTSTKGLAKLLHENSLKINLDSIFEAHDISDGKISDAGFSTITLTIDPVEHPGLTFGFISSVTFMVGLTNDSATSFKVSENLAIDPASNSVSFNILEGNLSTYVAANEFFFKIYGDMPGNLPEEQIHLIMNSTINFTVNPFD